MTKSSDDKHGSAPPESYGNDLTIWFAPNIPAALKPVEEPPEPDEALCPDWLWPVVEWWSPVEGSTRVFGTSSSATSRLADVDRFVRFASNRTLVSLVWWNGPGLSSCWSVCAIDFEASRLYFEWRELEGPCLLAYSDDPDASRSDREFLRAFFRDNGTDFDTTIMYGAPSEACAGDGVSRALLVELLASAIGGGEWWDDVPDDDVALARSIAMGSTGGE